MMRGLLLVSFLIVPSLHRTIDRESSDALGHPDLQGIWDQTTGTPLERAPELADREFLTEEEAVERETRRFRGFDEAPREGSPGNYGSQWRDGSRNALTRTSLVVDPPDGRVPALTDAGERARSPDPASPARPPRRFLG